MFPWLAPRSILLVRSRSIPILQRRLSGYMSCCQSLRLGFSRTEQIGVCRAIQKEWAKDFLCARTQVDSSRVPMIYRLVFREAIHPHVLAHGQILATQEHQLPGSRSGPQVELNELFTAWVQPQPRDALIASLRAADIPCAPVHSGVDDLMSDEHVRANDFLVGIEHPTKGRLWQNGGDLVTSTMSSTSSAGTRRVA